MKDYVSLLLRAINNYNEKDAKSRDNLRDLVCIISDDKSKKADPLVRELLYIASQKMRVFGYNVQNGFYKEKSVVNNTASELNLLSDASIRQHYQSKVRSNNILDKSQKEVIDFFQGLTKKRMLVSAPTSYGKTFIMREILFLNNKRYNNVLLVFPTIALLRENASNMEELNREKEMGYNVIKSIDGEIDADARNIFVFTPERAMQLLANYPNLVLNFFFYDEMYKIDEDYYNNENEEEKVDIKKASEKKESFLDEARAKTFRICLYLLSKKVDEYYLAGPNLKQEKFAPGMKLYIENNDISVKEIEFEPTKRIRVNAYAKKIVEDYSDIPYIEVPEAVKLSSKVNDKICDVVKYIADRGYGTTLLYCTTPAKANEYATKLANSHQGKVIKDKEFDVFLRHLKQNYNIEGSIKEWSFVSVLEKGFGMHHGKMPKYIQKEVLDLFERGVFELLFCTSTIVEGVNTSAKNMVILNHMKGSTPLTTFDFKNIIGRAGRYYHNFVGRFFLVDKELKKFEDDKDMPLDFITYNSEELSDIDIDNAEMEDLATTNREIKKRRIEKHKEFLLSDAVFEKNRLIKKEAQESLLQCLMENEELFDKFYANLKFHDILLQFTKFHAINIVLDIFGVAGLMDEFTIQRYKAISNNYCEEGFRGLLKYEIMKSKIPNKDGKTKTIDSAYMSAFKTQKEVLEHKIPKMLALFESIFVYVCTLKNVKLEDFSLSRVLRFYETGVQSYFGEQLIEYGFPVDAIRRIEKGNTQLLKYGRVETKKYVLDNMHRIENALDEYERGLLKKALKSIL